MSKKNRLKKTKDQEKKVVPNVSPITVRKTQPLLIIGLLAVAFCVAAYLGWTGLQSGSVAGCGPESGCGDVLSSRWSSWLGVPVSLLALPLYLVLILSAVRVGKDRIENVLDVLAFTALSSSVMIGLAAVWFTAIQGLVIGKFCPWCLTAHAAGLGASLLIARRFWFPRGENNWANLLTPKAKGFAALAGCAGVALLAGGQIAYEPDSYAVVTLQQEAEIEEAPAAKVTAKEAPAEEDEIKKPRSTRLRLHGGRFLLNASEHPLIGKLEAGNYVLSLFDYTCHHCRATHPHLASLKESFPEDLAIISLPTPLSADCNPMMQRLGRRTPSAHREACNYAAMSLAVYRLKPEVWREFDHWLFTGKNAPPVSVALKYAGELVGEVESVRQAMKDPWVGDQIRLAVEIYEANSQAKGQGSMPQLVVGNS
ncbi:hypothetical protein N8766_06655, partial [bacterium]|nr:hypothetical protein [bacterium]